MKKDIKKLWGSGQLEKDIPTNKIVCGNAIDVMEQMPECSIDLTVTSPPYDGLRHYKGYDFDFEAIARGLFKVTKKGGIVVWVVGDKTKNGNKSLTSFRQALYFQKIGFNIHDVMIYKKKNTPFMRTNAYTPSFEFMYVLCKGKPNTFNPLKVKTVRQGKEMLVVNKGADGINRKVLGELKPEKTMTNIWEYAVGLGGTTNDKIAFQHPAVFPEKLSEDHILSWTNKNDVVFDPMCGSGTTCKMAAKNQRSYFGCDISKEYVELANKRLAECSTKIDERTTSSAALTKRKSPISLTEKGDELLKRSGTDKFVLENKDYLLSKIKEHNPKTAYDVQEWCKTVLENVSNEDIFTPLKNYLFKEGLPLDSLIIVGQIYLRDIALPLLGFTLVI